MNILILAAHPDDECIGMGATIKKLSKKFKIHLCVVSDGASAQYSDKKMITERRTACKNSGKILGISNYNFLNFPDMKLDTVPHLEINRELEKIIKKVNPKIVYTTPNNDFNKDHQKVFESTLIVSRPQSSNVKHVFSYELTGKKQTNLIPNVYEDITKTFEYKIKSFKMYKSEVMKFPHPRSLKAIENLAIMRGVDSNLEKAEAFHLVHSINNK
tara:strand:- start:1339 stop:1983 length:645 start_codon:yes stop_codon:yes gene_type:complete